MSNLAVKTEIPNMVLRPAPGVVIRFATPKDKDGIMSNLQTMGIENAYVPVNFGKVRRKVDECINNFTAFVVEKEGRIVGAAGLFVSDQLWFSDVAVLSDYFFFVHPKHRDFRIANALLTECEKAARVLGVPLVIGVMSKKDAIRKSGFFARRMKPIGGFFISCLDVLRAKSA
jgi:N-acetylglutamate synthase-like GNAT family acetyltransferase